MGFPSYRVTAMWGFRSCGYDRWRGVWPSGSWEYMATDGEAEDDDFTRPIRAPRMKLRQRSRW